MLIKILKDGTQVAIPGTNSNKVKYIIEKSKKVAIVKAIPVVPKEIKEVEVVEEVEEIVEKPLDTWYPSLKELKSMLKVDLERLAKEYNLNTKGLKPVLRDRLIAYAEENGLFERW